MKFPTRKTLIALSAVLAVGIALPVFAGKMNPEQRLERMTNKLSLTPEQVEQIKPLMDKHHEEMSTFRKEREAEREKVREQVKAMHDQHYDQLKAVLTPEQATKLDEMKQRRMERHKGHYGKHGGKHCDGERGGKHRNW